MSASKRRLSIMFAIVCVPVLLGVSRAAPAADLGQWNPLLTTVYAATRADGTHKVKFDFNVLALANDSSTVPRACMYLHEVGGDWFIVKCGPRKLTNRGGGRFQATFEFTPSKPLTRTDASIKIRWTGEWSDYATYFAPIQWSQ